MIHPYNNTLVLLKQHPNWVAWGIRGAPPKIPCNPASLLSDNPQPAKAGIPETWGNYHTAAECV
jgi:primase-polymerase (primpol)-like protein